MLTATYSLVAIAAEQDNARRRLHRLQQYIHAAWKGLQNMDFGFLEAALNKLVQFDKYCRTRKVEMYLIPALRNTDREADALIAELDGISAAGMSILSSIGDQLGAAFYAGRVHFTEIYRSMELYCCKLSLRLEKEERVLLPMARRLLSTEEWFAIAAQFLSDEASTCVQERQRRAALPRSSLSGAVLMDRTAR